MGFFLPKNFKIKFFPINSFHWILNAKKNIKLPCTDLRECLENLILGPFWPKNFKTEVFPKIICATFKPSCCWNFMDPNEIYRFWTTIPFTRSQKNQSNKYSSYLFVLGASVFQNGGGILHESADAIVGNKAITLPKFF